MLRKLQKNVMLKKMIMDIKGKNLIAREHQTHDKCYRDYTHAV